MDALQQLHDDRHFSENERSIAHYLLDYPEEAAHISSRELARRTFTSASAVLRFCKKLGFENYNDFKISVVSELKSADLASTMIASGEHAITAMNKIAALEAQVIAETERKLSAEDVERIADLIHRADYVDFFARDANAATATYASHNFTLTGKISSIYQNMDKMVYLSFLAPEKHVAFFVSRSGTDHTLLVAARQLHDHGGPVIAVTASPDSPLARMSSYVLQGFYYPEFEKFGDVVFDSAMKYLFDVLFVMTFSKDYEKIQRLNHLYDKVYATELDRSKGAIV